MATTRKTAAGGTGEVIDRPGIREYLCIAESTADRIGDLAAITVQFRQGDPFDEIPVRGGISCGRPSVRLDGEDVHLVTWKIYLRMTIENAVLPPPIPHVVQDGSFTARSQNSTEFKTVTQHRLELLLDLKAGLNTFFGRFGFGFATNGSNRSQTAGESSTTYAPRITLIKGQGEDTIAFGDDDYGDPHHGRGFLNGDYPRPDRADSDRPLFTLVPHDASKPIRLTVWTTVPFDRLFVEIGDRPESVRKRRKRREAMHEKAIDEATRRGGNAVEQLRHQMAAAEMAARIGHNQKRADLPFRDGEFVVATKVYEISPTSMPRPRSEGDAP